MSTRARLWLDLALFAVLLIAYNPAWTGIAWHEWLSVAVVVPLLFHVVVNWDIVLRVLATFAERLRALPKVNLAVDAVLFVAGVTVMLSGLMISQSVARSLGVTLMPTDIWVRVHSWSADATIALLLAHTALHWRWLVCAARSLAARPSRAPARATQPNPVRPLQRRDPAPRSEAS